MVGFVKASVKTIGEYSAPPELARQIKSFESSVKQAFEDNDDSQSGRLTPTAVVQGNYSAKLGELVLVDPTSGALAISLPGAGRDDAGRELVVKNTTTSTNAITVRPPGSVKINATTAWTMSTSLQSTRFCWDGTAWWVIG